MKTDSVTLDIRNDVSHITIDKKIVRLSCKDDNTVGLSIEKSDVAALSPEMDVIEVIKDVDYYTGSYSITPLAKTSTTLPTKEKYLRQNITVEKVPYFQTYNAEDGYTVYIGELE